MNKEESQEKAAKDVNKSISNKDDDEEAQELHRCFKKIKINQRSVTEDDSYSSSSSLSSTYCDLSSIGRLCRRKLPLSLKRSNKKKKNNNVSFNERQEDMILAKLASIEAELLLIRNMNVQMLQFMGLLEYNSQEHIDSYIS